MSVVAGGDRRSARRDATRKEILAAAWQLARERGVGAWTMRDLGALVGMRAQSLYVYFPSKMAMLDAMFADGFVALAARLDEVPRGQTPQETLRRRSATFLAFAVEDLARYQLLFQRVVPGFEPSAQAYAVSVEQLAATRAALSACGVRRQRHVDLYTAMISGLAAQQTSNEPGGDRWTRLLDDAIDMFLDHVRTDRQDR
jgi:AcrR family transcriptional regulator